MQAAGNPGRAPEIAVPVAAAVHDLAQHVLVRHVQEAGGERTAVPAAVTVADRVGRSSDMSKTMSSAIGQPARSG